MVLTLLCVAELENDFSRLVPGTQFALIFQAAGKLAANSALFGFEKPHVALFGIEDEDVIFTLFPHTYLQCLVTPCLHSKCR